MRVLQYAVRLPMLLRYFGQLCIALAALTIIPFSVSLYFGEFAVSLRYGMVALLVAVLGILLSRQKTVETMQSNEAMVITVLIFLFSPLVMTWPTMAAGLRFGDALFETVSAVTTTGLSTLPTLTDASPSFLFSRAWMQWIGGLGIVVLCMATLIQPGLSAKRLDLAESFEEDIIGSTRSIAQRTFFIYCLLTLIGIFAMVLAGADTFNAILYVLAAVSTGGFSPHDTSIEALTPPAAQIIVLALSMAGGVSLLLYSRIHEKGWRFVCTDQQLKAFLTASILVILLLACFLRLQDGLLWSEAFRHGTINGLSAISTAGFSSTDIAQMGNGAQLLLILAMATGGCAGSTAGGIKMIRLLVLFRMLYLVIQRAGAPPRAVLEARLNNKKLGSAEIINAVSLFILFTSTTAISWLLFLALDHAPLASLFEIVSALGTVGLSAGITTEALHPVLKTILCLDMLLGRLEIIAWLIFFHPKTWIGLRKEE